MEETMLGRFRWWLFKKVSALGWAVCPEPHRTILQSGMPNWETIERSAGYYFANPIQPLKGE